MRPKSPHLYLLEDRGYSSLCFVWQRGTTTRGYGVLRVAGRLTLAHRHFYEQAHGPLGADLQIDHACRVPSCVNPAHMEPVTSAENTRRGRSAKLTHAAVAEIRARLAAGVKTAAVAEEFAVTPGTIRRIRCGLRWAAA